MANPQNQKPPFALRALGAFAATLAVLFALLLTWKKPLWQALRGIVLSEVLGILCFFPLYALVGMLSWQWFRWGGVSLQEILSFWKGGGATAALWIGPGVGETALVLLLRWVVETVRQRLALPGEKSVP